MTAQHPGALLCHFAEIEGGLLGELQGRTSTIGYHLLIVHQILYHVGGRRSTIRRSRVCDEARATQKSKHSDAINALCAGSSAESVLIHLRLLVREFVEHYNQERRHQGLSNRLIDPEPLSENDNGSTDVVRRSLGY